MLLTPLTRHQEAAALPQSEGGKKKKSTKTSHAEKFQPLPNSQELRASSFNCGSKSHLIPLIPARELLNQTAFCSKVTPAGTELLPQPPTQHKTTSLPFPTNHGAPLDGTCTAARREPAKPKSCHVLET